VEEIRFTMSEVTFVDSSGLRVVIDALRRVEPANGRVVVVDPSPVFQRLLALTGVDHHVTIETTDGSPDGAP
jgi:anti-sigma B factor antagonist